MILPMLNLASRANCVWTESGLDSFSECLNKEKFLKYPDKIEYRYNSKGFRDDEWPEDLESAIWCVGDSFTVGIGTSYNHIWPQKLSALTGRRTINVSMDGASNNWIARQVRDIYQSVNPKNIVVMWSYVERRENSVDENLNIFLKKFYNNVKDPSWPECPDVDQFSTLPLEIRKELAAGHSLEQYLKISQDLESLEVVNLDELSCHVQLIADEEEHIENFKHCIDTIKNIKSNLIYSFIPGFAQEKYQDVYVKTCQHNQILPLFKKIDIARDGHHFDRLTSQWVAEQIVPWLK